MYKKGLGDVPSKKGVFGIDCGVADDQIHGGDLRLRAYDWTTRQPQTYTKTVKVIWCQRVGTVKTVNPTP